MAEQITDEEAQRLAAKWLVDRVTKTAERGDHDAWEVFGHCPCWSHPSSSEHAPSCLLHEHRPLSDAERERLFAWVRKHMAMRKRNHPYPEQASRSWLVSCVESRLDLDDLGGMKWWPLCEAAGWPS